MRDFEELMLMRSFFGNASAIWVTVVLVGGILLALIFRPQNVRSPSMLMIAGLCVAVSMVAPSIVSWFSRVMIEAESNSGSRFSSRPGSDSLYVQFLMLLPMMVGPLFQGAAVLFAMLALLPRRQPRAFAGPMPGSMPPQPAGGPLPVPMGQPPQPNPVMPQAPHPTAAPEQPQPQQPQPQQPPWPGPPSGAGQ